MENKTPHILVIDDAPEGIRSLLALLSTQAAWRLSLATDPHQGLHRARALHPDLILLDVHMPKMDGFALCRLLQESPTTCNIPVIFLTSACSLEDRLAGLTGGGVDYVVKPCEAQEVLARVRVHLALTRKPEPEISTKENVPEDSEQVLLRAATRFIEENLAELPPLGEIAATVGTYEKRLSQLFRQRLGHSVFTFARQRRLQKGCQLLTDSELSIQDIAELMGFQSAGNFSTAFRKEQGMTPREFREHVRTGTSVQ